MRHAIRVQPNSFNFFTGTQQRIRDGRADTGVILVVAGAVKFVMSAVEQKTVRRIEGHGADAKRRFLWSTTLPLDEPW